MEKLTSLALDTVVTDDKEDDDADADDDSDVAKTDGTVAAWLVFRSKDMARCFLGDVVLFRKKEINFFSLLTK